MKVKSLKEQLIDIKGRVSTILSREMVFDYEEDALTELYNLVDDIVLDNVNHKRFSVEEVVDNKIMELTFVLGESTNREIKRLVRVLNKGLNW